MKSFIANFTHDGLSIAFHLMMYEIEIYSFRNRMWGILVTFISATSFNCAVWFSVGTLIKTYLNISRTKNEINSVE